jgi:hypothetical protein
MRGCPPCVRPSLAEEKGEMPETSDTNPRVRVPTAKAGGRHAEASLAWAWATTLVKRRQRASGPWSSPEIPLSWRPTRWWARKATPACQIAGASGPGTSALSAPPGSRTRARTQGLARNLRDLDASARAGTVARAQRARPGRREVGVPQYERRRRGTYPQGPGRAKGGTGSQNRARERWERLRAHQPPTRKSNG